MIDQVETKTLILPSGEVAVLDAADWEREFRLEWKDGGVLVARPAELSWRARRTKHSIYVVTTVWLGKNSAGQPMKYVPLHRLITGAKPGEDVDHKNCDGLDNRSANLRTCSRGLNNANQRLRVGKQLPKGVSRVKGRDKFQANIGYNGKRYGLGHFDSAEEAAAAYAAKARELFGEFARLE